MRILPVEKRNGVGVAAAPQTSECGTWENRGGQDSSLRTPIGQPIGRGVLPSGARPDLAFLILAKWSTNREWLFIILNGSLRLSAYQIAGSSGF